MKLILTRHGITIENERGVLQGHLPGNLSHLGKEQVKRLAMRLKDEHIDAIYSSDLKRAAHTTREIAHYHPDAHIYFSENLRELDWGSLSGKAKPLSPEDIPDDVESANSIRTRSERFIQTLIQNHHNQTVLVVAHDSFNRYLMSVIMKKNIQELSKELGKHHHTSISIFEIDEDKNHTVHLLNCDKHLR